MGYRKRASGMDLDLQGAVATQQGGMKRFITHTMKLSGFPSWFENGLMLVGMQSGTVTLENSLVVSYETKHIINYHTTQQLQSWARIPEKINTYVHTKTLCECL